MLEKKAEVVYNNCMADFSSKTQFCSNNCANMKDYRELNYKDMKEQYDENTVFAFE